MDVIFDQNLGDVWRKSVDRNYNGIARLPLGYLSRFERLEAERTRQSKLLFVGAHRQYFVEEKRGGKAYPPLEADCPEFYEPLNLLGLVSKKTADLLFGKSPRISCEDKTLQQTIDGIIDRSWLVSTLLTQAIECSWAGRTYLEIQRIGGVAYISAARAEEIYPQGAPGPDKQFAEYRRYSTALVAGVDGAEPVQLLLVVSYASGLITRQCYRCDGGIKGTPLPIENWPTKQPDGSPLPTSQPTGLGRPSIVYVPNEEGGASDYDGMIDAQRLLNDKHTQLARVLHQHADPTLAVPETAADENGNLPARAKVYFKKSGDTDKPEYITWDPHLEAALQDRTFAINALCMLTEMSQVLLGLKEGGAQTAAKTLRLEATNSLAKAGRKALYWAPAIRLAIQLAVQTETGAMPTDKIGVELQDGLPDDALDTAQVVATARGAKAMALKRALMLQGLDAATADAEAAEIEAENKADMPSVLLGEPASNDTTNNAVTEAGTSPAPAGTDKIAA